MRTQTTIAACALMTLFSVRVMTHLPEGPQAQTPPAKPPAAPPTGYKDTPKQPDGKWLVHDDDRPQERVERKVLTSATAAAFTNDGLEIAIIAGGDLWVMDTELREPKRITYSPEEDRQPIFSSDQQSIYFISDAGGKPEIWRSR